MIHALLDTTQVIGTLQIDGSPFEVCAEALANHDRHSNQFTVNLRAFLRATMTTPTWLHAPQTVTEHVDADEAHAMATDIFARWCHKLTVSLPQ